MNNNHTLALVEKRLEELGLSDIPAKLFSFEKYREGILSWNEKVNLTAIKDPVEFEQKHFVDSLSVCTLPVFSSTKTVIDIGTGGGFPGIPLAIAQPEKKFVLMDSLKQRLRNIDTLCEEIGITNVTTVHGRAEELGRKPEFREQFDLCVSRAVAQLPSLCELCIPFVKVDGDFISYKGPTGEDEAAASAKAMMCLGECSFSIEKAGTEDEHLLVCIHKNARTQKAYPRAGNKAIKNPL